MFDQVKINLFFDDKYLLLKFNEFLDQVFKIHITINLLNLFWTNFKFLQSLVFCHSKRVIVKIYSNFFSSFHVFFIVVNALKHLVCRALFQRIGFAKYDLKILSKSLNA